MFYIKISLIKFLFLFLEYLINSNYRNYNKLLAYLIDSIISYKRKF